MRTSRCLQATIAFLIFLSFNSTSLFAQSSKVPFSDTLVSEFCEVFSKAAIGPEKENMSAELGLLLIPLITKYKAQIQIEWGYNIDDAQELHKASEKIGQLAVTGCPAFLDFVKNNMDELKSESKPAKTFTGKLLRVEGSPFSYLLVQNKVGKTEKIYWMEFFEGSDLINSRVGAPINKAVAIRFKEIELYDAASKEYRNVKVATKLELK